MTNIDKIVELNELLKKGLITQEEFEEHKKRLLESEQGNKEIFVPVDEDSKYKVFLIKNIDLSAKNLSLKSVMELNDFIYADMYFTDNSLVLKYPKWSEKVFDDISVKYDDLNFSVTEGKLMRICKIVFITLFINEPLSLLYCTGSLMDNFAGATAAKSQEKAMEYATSKSEGEAIINELESHGVRKRS